MDNLGKKFEEYFKRNWMKCFPGGMVFRLNDQLSGYKSVSQNPSDFICYEYPTLFFMEIKTHKGASIPFDAIPQYPRLIKYSGIKGIRSGCVVWLYEKDLIFYLPASTIKKMMEDGKKSAGLKSIEEGYNIITIPTNKKRLFLDGDYTVLMSTKEGE